MRFLLSLLFLSHVIELDAQPFEVFANGHKIQVYEQNDVGLSHELESYKFVRIPYTGSAVKLLVKATGFTFDDSDWSISPKRYKIKGVKSGNNLSFSVDRLGYVVVRFKKNQDFTKRLVLLFEAPEEVPDNCVDIVDAYGVDNSGQKNETVKWKL